jgi:hypothetical protein
MLQAIHYYGIDQRILAIAEDELFVNRHTQNQNLSVKISIPFANFIEQTNFINRTKLIIQRIFISPQTMSRKYPVQASYNDPKLYFYYLIRFRGLWQRYYQYTQKLILGNTEVSGATRRKYLLNQWLEEKSQ